MAITMSKGVAAVGTPIESDLLVMKPPAPRSATLRALDGRTFIQVFPEYVRLTGSLPASMLLGWLVYWFLPTQDGKSKIKNVVEGKRWTYRTYGEVSKDTGLTKMQAVKARWTLEALGLIQVRDGAYNGHRSLSWHLDMRALHDKLNGLSAHSSAQVADPDEVMGAEMGVYPLTVEASYLVPPTVVSGSYQLSLGVDTTVGSGSTKLITNTTQESEDLPKISDAASAAQQQVGEEPQISPDGFEPVSTGELEKKRALNERLGQVRAKYGRNSPRLSRQKPPNTPNMPWLGIHAKLRPGSGGAMVGGIRVKKEESGMVFKKPDSKFKSRFAISDASAADVAAKFAHSSAGLDALAAKPVLTSSQVEMVWKKCIGNQYGFMPPFTLMQRGQLGHLAKRLSGKEIVGLFQWLFSTDLTKEGVKRWTAFTDAAQTEAGAKGAPALPHVGFLLTHYGVAMRLYHKAAAMPVGPVVKTSPPAPAVATPKPAAPVPEATDDTPMSLKLQLGRAMLKGLKAPPDLTPAQVEEYKNLALMKDQKGTP